MIKKILCILTAAIITASATIIPTAEANVREQNSKIDFLINIGIMDPITDDQIQLVDTIKRKDFAVLLARMINGGKDLENSGKCEFVDVDLNDPTTPYIVYAHEHDLLNGYGEGIFKPDVAVKYEEAVKCLVCMLGYNVSAEMEGSFPDGYMNVAAGLKMLNGVSAKRGEFISLKDMAVLIYNSLEIPYMMIDFSGEDMQYVKSEESTILSEAFDMYKEQGIITGNSKTSLDSNVQARKGHVIINGEEYETGTTNAEELIGQYVKYYYVSAQKSDEKTLAVVIPHENRNNVLKLESEDITDVYLASGNESSKITYDPENSKKSLTAKISPKADVLLNGVVCFEYDSAAFMPDTGSVTLIDNNGDNTYDVVSIEKIDTYIVNNVSAHYGKVTDFYDSTKILYADESNGRDEINVVKPDGEQGTFNDIKAWDVLSVRESQTDDRKYVEIKISRNVVSGKSTKMSDDTVVIDGTEYKINNTLKKYVENNIAKFKIGTTQKFCIDTYGKVAAIKEEKKEGNCYYIRRVSKDEGEGNTIISAWNISADDWETYSIDENKKISIDGTKTEIFDEIEKKFVRFIKNKDGDISKIYTCKAEFENDRNLQRCSGVGAYMDTSSGGEVAYYSSENTVGVTIPKSDEYANDKSMYVKKISNFGDTKWKYVQLYDVKDYIPAIIVYKSDAITGSDNVGIEKPSMIVTDISEELYDNDILAKISGYTSSGETSYLLNYDVRESDTFKKLKVGDFVRVETNTENIGTALAIDYSTEGKKILIGGKSYSYGSSFTDLNIFCGYVAEVNQSANIIKIKHSYGEGIATAAVSVAKMPSVVLINNVKKSGKQKFEFSDSSAIQEGQFIVIRRKAGKNQIAEIFAN